MDVLELSEAVETKAPFWVRMTWRFGRKAYLFAKGAAWLVVSLIVGLVQQYDVADVVGFVRSAFSDSVKLPLIVVGIVSLWLFVRQMTSGPKGFSAKADLNDGD